MILPDNETRVDLLNNEAIATTIVRLLRDRPDQPVSVGVHGDWGAGKSSVLEMIEAGLEGEEKVLCLKFNGWRFQGFEDAKIALIEDIVTGLIEKRPALKKAEDAVKDILRRIDWLKAAKKVGGLAFTAFSGIPSPDQVQSIVGTLEGFLGDPTKLATKDNIQTAIDGVRSLLKPKEEGDLTNVPEEINGFRNAFDDLLEKAGVEQLVVLIDDLDRCLPDTAIETLEAVRLFVFTSRTAFVVAADEAMIEYAVRKHFPDLPDTTGPQTYARNYLEKLIQVPFRIPALGDTETRIYITLLLIGAELGEDDPAFSTLIAAARERLKRPWIASALDATATEPPSSPSPSSPLWPRRRWPTSTTGNRRSSTPTVLTIGSIRCYQRRGSGPRYEHVEAPLAAVLVEKTEVHGNESALVLTVANADQDHVPFIPLYVLQVLDEEGIFRVSSEEGLAGGVLFT